MIILIQQQLIPLYTTWYNTRYAIWLLIQQQIYDMTLRIQSLSHYYPWTWRPPAAAGGPPHRCADQVRLGGRHATIQDYEFRVIILLFFLFCHLCYSISAYPKTHKPRGRASDVSCYNILPTPPPISVRTAGVSLLCTCAAFSPLC